tara:strand:- start:3623 stop:4333 length:711 start_codon:yes stop_codon:yes gene_type:complete
MDILKKFTNDSIKLLKKYNLLKPLVKQLILDNCIKDTLIEKKRIEDIKQQIFKTQNLKNEEEFASWLNNSSKTEEEFFDAITKPMKINDYVMKEFGHKTRSRFVQKKSSLDSVVYSLVRVNDSFLAKELYHQISDGEYTFEDIAKQYSVGPERHSKGIVGPVSLEGGHPKMNELLRVSLVGEVNEPIQINDVFAVTRLEHINEVKLDEKMELQMAKDIFEEWLDKEASLVCSNLKK